MYYSVSSTVRPYTVYVTQFIKQFLFYTMSDVYYSLANHKNAVLSVMIAKVS